MKKLLLIALMVIGITAQAQWTKIGQDIDGEAAGDNSGRSVCLSNDGSILAIGARKNDGNGTDSGHVRVFENIGGIWSQIGVDIDGESAGDELGHGVSLNSDGSIVAIGGQYNNGNGTNSGHVRVYETIGGTWIQVGQDIDGEAAGDRFGSSVSLSTDGSVLAVGARWNAGNGGNSGHVRVYENIDGTWTQIGQDIDGEAAGDNFGTSVSLSSDGSIVAAGAVRNDGNGGNSGHVRVYENISGTWIQVGQDIDGEAAGDWFGSVVSLSSDGSIVAGGAWYNDGNGTDAGHVRVFENIGGTWTQIGQDIDGEEAGDASGDLSLSSDGSIVAIGASWNDGNGTDAGHLRVYENMGGTWIQIGADIDGEAPDDWSGFPVSMNSDGTIVAVGAIYNDGNGTDSGHVRVYEYEILGFADPTVYGISIYPNPVNDILNITAAEAIETISIRNILGKELYKSNVDALNAIIDLSAYTMGTYLVKVQVGDRIITEKIIKK